MSRQVRLVASSDDFLLEARLAEVVAAACAALGAPEAEPLSNDVEPERLALELQSPSLFSPVRVLVVADVRGWVDTTTPEGAPRITGPLDIGPLLTVLSDGIPDGMALVMGAWCGRRPKGPLVDALAAVDALEWIALPEPPKPWEDVSVSPAQRDLLGRVLATAAGDVRFTPGAANLLFERLGFAPRQLAQEAAKLAVAAGPEGEVGEALVRSLTFPAERSLEVVRDAILDRDAVPLLGLVAAVDVGTPLRDWQGRRVDPPAVPFVLLAQISSVLLQVAVVRQSAAELGLGRELDPDLTEQGNWYGRRFKKDLGPRLLDHLQAAAPNPLIAGTKKKASVSVWRLAQLFRGAARWSDEDLETSLESLGGLERRLRGEARTEALVAWISSAVR